ncbi:MAG TPA: chromosome segregation SMC family protein [Nitrososphaeraceae archaeon]
MYIKKLEIYGFKSFGFKNTVLHFDNGLVAVTGPNGSGKSNILDAIIFVLGENSPKTLRVDRLQSLFHDSQNPSHRLIRVSIVFDNTDRGIPVDSDTVSMSREMEGQAGDSQYYLNGKKVSKLTLLELLEIVVAAPNKLNIVQQGMITRISELNTEERRRIIEDLIGLSYFDEKKTEALNQLSESDRRLEVAMARMGEIRKRIDELEEERNDQIRYQFIEAELKRLKAILYSNKIRHLQNEMHTRNEVLAKDSVRLEELSVQITDLRKIIESTEAEKTNFMQEVDKSNKAKAQIDAKITSIVYDLERTKAVVKEGNRRLIEISDKLPILEVQVQELNSDTVKNEIILKEKRATVNLQTGKLTELKSQFGQKNTRLEELSIKVDKTKKLKESLMSRSSKLLSIDGTMKISLARLEEKFESLQGKIRTDQSRKDLLDQELQVKMTLANKIKMEIDETTKVLRNQDLELEKSRDYARIMQEKLHSSSQSLIRARQVATSYESRIELTRSLMNEDIALTRLFEHPSRFGIIGLVKDLLEWDPIYQKAIFASTADWMKACIVLKVSDMIRLVSFLKENHLPRLRIIPLEIVIDSRNHKTMKRNPNVLGSLADFAHCAYAKQLPDFLLGNTILVRNASTAYQLSTEGFRVVTIDGELFEPNVRSMSVDYGSQLTDISLDVLIGDHVTALVTSSDTLDKLLKMRKKDLDQKNTSIEKILADKRHFENLITELNIQNRHLEESISMMTNGRAEIINELLLTRSDLDKFEHQIGRVNRRLDLIAKSLRYYSGKIQNCFNNNETAEFSKLDSEKNELLKLLELSEIQTRENITSLASTENAFNILIEKKAELQSEIEKLSLERKQKLLEAETGTRSSDELEAELVRLREDEQKIIKTGGDSYSVLQDYDRKLKSYSEQEKMLMRESTTIEKESVALKKDVTNFSTQESQTYNDLVWLGYKGLVESEKFDVENIIRELTLESEKLRSNLNLRADESYIQVTDGYRGMSARKNELESERNSIVLFIEEIVSEKKTVFMQAFDKVNEDIKKTFSEVSEANAYLQLENQEDVFAGGLMYLVQFPGKPARESTALSGGEKTMAATIFLLALQSLKPSPFYLMDEVDAHLDAQNTEKLSKVLFQRSQGSQIIMVTLKESTVAKADQIYGVYPKAGISQIVYYKNPSHVPMAQVQLADRS